MSDEADPDSDRRSRRRRLRGALARTARIARWEVSRSAGTVDRKTVLVLAALALVVGVVGFSAAGEGLGLEDEIYVVAVDEDSRYHDVAVESEAFRPMPLDELVIENGDDANADVVLTRNGELAHYGPHGEAAHDAFIDAIDSYNEQRLRQEANQTAAYPVHVELDYQKRDFDGSAEPDESDGASSDGSDDGTDAGSGTGTETTDGSGGEDSSDGGSGDDTTSGGATGGDADGSGQSDGTDDSGDGRLQVPNVGASGAVDGTSGPPGSISPPFPFQSLLLAFLFVVPMNFVIQAYGSTIMDERVKRRGELLLVSPASRREIVAGKTLPYLLGLIAVAVGITVAVQGGLLSIAAAIPIALLFLAATFAGAMLARSYKELTFVTVTISVFLTTYTFIPAVFADVNPIALISPLTLIVTNLQGESVSLGEYVFSTAPFYCSAAVCFLLGIGVYREEDMFAQKALPAKVLDAIASRLHSYRSVAVLTMLFIPFVFAGQLLAVAVLFAVPEQLAVPIVIVLAAAIEEVAKSVHVYAGFVRSRFDASLRVAAVLGVCSGAGFFLGEKVTHVVQFVGLPELTVGAAAFGPDPSGGPLVLVAVFLAPLVLHVVTAVISAIGASRGPNAYSVGFLIATLVHAGYNLGVIALVA
ncbi:ABC-type Na+ efflux pump permease component- like protein [Haloterrigena turkmenica DSM 5511]|uniref:ABC-type Na+ efflux pump permease component-like protein n=1 Tax=Haloterrigena turkmenica (strain ATCC 51198 / DSM 5511 / JCM 9101 / NCIMB 13204 / VKM B-1734 / 4k) TaxID=543526 RepID=D2RQV2_HALTV|nr:ABC transporter permease subunit [Haloterrigena turkmenica]ADB60433.1 ABC-type Na+ efflux pump permease component- like protein [Haloterrigena turkmenica DSM 5511]